MGLFKKSNKDKCEIETINNEDSVTMRCKNLRRMPTSEEVMNAIKEKRLKFDVEKKI